MEELKVDEKVGKKLEDLSQINLSKRKITIIEFDVLNRCSKLEYLDLSRNRLKSLVGIYLPNLKFLNIEDNCISDVTFLTDLPKLEKLFIDGNPLTIADRYIAVDQLKNLESLDGKSCGDMQAKLKLYHMQLHSEAARIFSSKYESVVRNSTSLEQVIQQRRLFTREMLNWMSSCNSMAPKFQRYKVQDYVDKLFKEFECSHTPQTPRKVQKCVGTGTPTSTVKKLQALKLSSPAKENELPRLSSPRRSARNSSSFRLAPSSALTYLESSQSSPTVVGKRLESMKISTEENKTPTKSRRKLDLSTSSPVSNKSPLKRKREVKPEKSTDKSWSGPRNISYSPHMFLRCHVPSNDPQDCKTQVWAAAFELNNADPSRTTDLVATCGGNLICFINCQTGHVLKRYKCESKTENLFSVCWTVLEHGTQKQCSSILAAAGNEKKIYLIHPSQLKCFLVFKAHSEAINCLKFHPNEPTWLFSGGRDSFVYLWDIGDISLTSYSGSQKKLSVFEAKGEIVQIAISLKFDCLFASTQETIAVWNINTSVSAKKPSLLLTLPDSCKSEESGVVDGLTFTSDTTLALKVSKSGKIALWDVSDIFQGKKLIRGLHNISPLAIFLWSDGDCDYSYLDSCPGEQLVAGGDNAGRLWLYDVSMYAGNRNKDFANELSLPCSLLPWPKLLFDDEALAVKQRVIINSVQFSRNGDYLVACTDTNLVCIWKKKGS